MAHSRKESKKGSDINADEICKAFYRADILHFDRYGMLDQKQLVSYGQRGGIRS
jgi:hypothetical protein